MFAIIVAMEFNMSILSYNVDSVSVGAPCTAHRRALLASERT